MFVPFIPAPATFLLYSKMHGVAIRRNTIQSMQAIIEATVTLHIELDDEAAEAGMRILNLDETADLTPSVVQVRSIDCSRDYTVLYCIAHCPCTRKYHV